MKVKKPYRLSQSFVNAITEPGRYGDGRGSRGLSLLVKRTKSGDVSKTYTQRIQQPSGKFTSRGLGAHPYVSLKDARDLAYQNVVGNIAPAIGFPAPIHQPHSEPTLAPTLREVTESYLDANSGTWAATTLKTYRGVLKLQAFETLADMPINTIANKDVIDAFKRDWNERHSAADMALKKLANIFSHAISYGYVDRNVAKDAKGGLGSVKVEIQSARFVEYADMNTVLFRAATEGNARSSLTKKALLFMLLTGTRVSTALSFEWTDIKHGDGGTYLEIPQDRSGVKGAQGFRIPLSRQAYELLMAIEPEQDIDSDDMRIFQRGTSSVSGFLDRHNFDFSPHGIRTTFTTWAQEQTSYPTDLLDECLAHIAKNATQRRYFRSDSLEKRRAVMQDFADYVMPDIDEWLKLLA